MKPDTSKQKQSKGFGKGSLHPTPIQAQPGKPPDQGMIWIAGGSFLMGSDHHYPEEAPLRQETVSGFWIDRFLVTNQQFQRFIKATGYATGAERTPQLEAYPGALPELLVPGSLVFRQPPLPVDLDQVNWWEYVPGANWRHPEGPGSSIKGREYHPVVHITAEDAEAYATWAGKVLPTEAQWEFAARGGLEGADYQWGNEWMPGGKALANFWIGEFPSQNLKPRSPGTTPVGIFPSNGYGLYDMIGNVWEWTTNWYRDRSPIASPQPCCLAREAGECTREESFDPTTPAVQIPRRVLKGGSFLCALNYCQRYRPAARHPEMIDTSTGHIGFRCVVNLNILP